jgi:hypothetical protein
MIAYDRLSQIVPQGQALAAKALATSLQQITSVTNLTLPTLAQTVANLQTTINLPLVAELTQPVTANAVSYLSNIANTNGAPVVICDVLGIAAGYNITGTFVNTVSTLSNTSVGYLTTIYQTMNNVVTNAYGDVTVGPVIIPSGVPAAGTYYANTDGMGNVFRSAGDAAFTGIGGDSPPGGPGLIPTAQIEVGNISVSSAAQVAVLNSYFNSMGAQVAQEKNLQNLAQIDFNNLVSDNTSSVYSLVYDLHTYGDQTELGGMVQFWQGVANIDTFTGQAVLATIREGVNLGALNAAGIPTDTIIPSDPNPPLAQANLIPATYTADQAANVVVR